MLKIYDANDPNNVIPLKLNDNKKFVTHKYDGADTLTFEIAASSEVYKYIAEEVKVEDDKNQYIIKKIDEHSDFVTVDCNLNTDDWKKKLFYTFRMTGALLSEVLDAIIPEGWNYSGAGNVLNRTTIEGNEGEPLEVVTPLDIMGVTSDTFGCVFNYDCINKIVKVILPESFTSSGEFFTDEINLKSLGFVGDSTNFVTRLYAYGKKDEETGEPLTFADINDGKEYVENFKYSDKIVSMGWSDERYTVKENLLADAKAKLEELSHPLRSYSCDVINLNEDIWMYKVVTLIDRRRGTRVEHRVVEYKEYPNHKLDVVTLSSVSPSIQSTIEQIKENTEEKLEQQHMTIKDELERSVEYATQKITGNKGGHFLWVFDNDGKPIELLNLADSDDIDKAQKIWRWNASGLGHSNNGYNGPYELALLDDGSINADVIKTGTLEAGLIKAGILSDALSNVSWNLETGALAAKKLSIETPNFTLDNEGSITSKNGTIEGSTIKGSTVEGNTIKNGDGAFSVDENGKMVAKDAEINGEICGLNGYSLRYYDNAKPPVPHDFVFAETNLSDGIYPYLIIKSPSGNDMIRCGYKFYITKPSSLYPYAVDTPIFDNGIYVNNAVINTLFQTHKEFENISNGKDSVDLKIRASGAFITVYGSYHTYVHAAGESKEIVITSALENVYNGASCAPLHQAVRTVGHYGKRAFSFAITTDGKFTARNASTLDIETSDVTSINFRFDYFML